MERDSLTSEIVLVAEETLVGVEAMANAGTNDPFEMVAAGGITTAELHHVVKVTSSKPNSKTREVLKASNALDLVKLLGLSTDQLERFLKELGIEDAAESEMLVRAAKSIKSHDGTE